MLFLVLNYSEKTRILRNKIFVGKQYLFDSKEKQIAEFQTKIN